jgi:hypothetical protein
MDEFVSGYAIDPMAGFSSRARDLLLNSYVKPKVKTFFGIRGIENYRKVSPSNALAGEHDYAPQGKGGAPFSYFYEVLLSGIQKKEESIEGIAYTLTLDKTLTREGHCEKSGLHYGNAFLGEEPFFYYLRLDMQKMLRRLKTDASSDLPVQYEKQ